MNSNPYWTVAQAVVAREPYAAANLQRAGYRVYLPVTRIHPRRNVVALFPSYLFVRVEQRWSNIQHTVGVVRLLRAGDVPARLPERVVADLQAREVDGVVALPTLRRGQTVRVVGGSLRGRLAIYQGMAGRDRERVLIEFLGRQVSAVVAVGDVAAH
jgi:transcription antitermination factor NusG